MYVLVSVNIRISEYFNEFLFFIGSNKIIQILVMTYFIFEIGLVSKPRCVYQYHIIHEVAQHNGKNAYILLFPEKTCVIFLLFVNIEFHRADFPRGTSTIHNTMFKFAKIKKMN